MLFLYYYTCQKSASNYGKVKIHENWSLYCRFIHNGMRVRLYVFVMLLFFKYKRCQCIGVYHAGRWNVSSQSGMHCHAEHSNAVRRFVCGVIKPTWDTQSCTFGSGSLAMRNLQIIDHRLCRPYGACKRGVVGCLFFFVIKHTHEWHTGVLSEKRSTNIQKWATTWTHKVEHRNKLLPAQGTQSRTNKTRNTTQQKRTLLLFPVGANPWIPPAQHKRKRPRGFRRATQARPHAQGLFW